MGSVADRVNEGIIELDTHVPDWRSKVNSGILLMDSHKDCILGQIYGSYFSGVKALDLTDETVIVYGFETEDYSEEGYEELSKEWQRRLTGDNENA